MLLLNGSDDKALMRAMIELSQWLLKSEGEGGEAGYDITAITNLWVDLIYSCQKGKPQLPYKIRMALPLTRELSLAKKIWASEPEI